MEKDEYELVPITPMRRLEKRIEELEKTAGSSFDKEFFKELVDIVRMNQQIVDELAKANDALRIELSKLPSKLDDLVSNLNELLSYVKASAAEESTPQIPMKPLLDKIDQLIESNKKIAESNQSVLAALGELDKKMRRPAPPPPSVPIRRPGIPPKLV